MFDEREGLEGTILPPDVLFLQELETIERAIRYTCRRAGLREADAEDFGSWVKLRIIENDYAVLRKFEYRCGFGAFISVVIQRLLLDYRILLWGRWHASSEAKRAGEIAIAVEAMVHRDGWTVEEALPALQRRWPHLTRRDIDALMARLPRRPGRPRSVGSAALELLTGNRGVEELAFEGDRLYLSRRVAAVVRRTFDQLSEGDRLLVRFRFQANMSVAEIARLMGLDQKPLYRRLQRLLAAFRNRLAEEGIDASAVHEILASRSIDLDFGFPATTLPQRPASVSVQPPEEEGS